VEQKEENPRRTDALAAIDEGRYADAQHMLGNKSTEVAGALRETAWRWEAEQRFSDPRAILSLCTEQIARQWTGIKVLGKELRNAFAEFVFTTGDGKSSLAKKGSDNVNSFSVKCSEIQEWLSKQQLNPCYLPQLARFEKLLVLAPPILPSEINFLQRVASLISEHQGSLPIVIAPGITKERREDVLRELRKRESVGCIIDDLDMCRLINPHGQRGNTVIGLMEIALEQQRWPAVSPFIPHEGQHVQMELYVGRRQIAKDVAATPRYSRLFSGRKLGKSALLKYIQDRFDQSSLPSGQKLRALYLNIAGAESEADVSNRIVTEMVKKFKIQGSDRTDPGDQLVETMRAYVEHNFDEDILIVLDEADVFVEAQIKEFDERKERCLTFRMSREIEGLEKQSGTWLPRVRFLFSGYRVTNTTEGVWRNWGDVLKLDPLEPADAVALVAGPLARLGIDASEKASLIAWRSGYQPVVLLRFGEKLLEHLASRNRFDLAGAKVEVGVDDVAIAFDSEAVKEEIRNVTAGNFQGNNVAQVVFDTLLLEFYEAPHGAAIEDAAARIVERLKKIGGDLNWLHRDESSAMDEVTRHIRTLVDRRLIIPEHNRGGSAYSLKFPHHLTLLCQPNQERIIFERIQELRRGDRNKAAPATMHSLIPHGMRDEIRYLIFNSRDDGFATRAVVLGSYWTAAARHQTGGVPARVGIDPRYVRSALEPMDQEFLKSNFAAFYNVNEKLAEDLMKRQGSDIPPVLLLGGADLLRWALHRQKVDSIELFCLGRLTQNSLNWWFQRVRCWELPNESAVSRIFSLTHGIPFLVRIIDEELLKQTKDTEGTNVTHEMWDKAFYNFEVQLQPEVQRLVQGAPEFLLTRRELEILRLVIAVARLNRAHAFSINELIQEWDVLYKDICPIPGPMPADRINVAVLLQLGLLPSDPSGNPALPLEYKLAIADDDPIFKMCSLLSEMPV